MLGPEITDVRARDGELEQVRAGAEVEGNADTGNDATVADDEEVEGRLPQTWVFQQDVLWKNLAHVTQGIGTDFAENLIWQPPHTLLLDSELDPDSILADLESLV